MRPSVRLCQTARCHHGFIAAQIKPDPQEGQIIEGKQVGPNHLRLVITPDMVFEPDTYDAMIFYWSQWWDSMMR
jgi:hypothetical protein